jgi:hypothetical protein
LSFVIIEISLENSLKLFVISVYALGSDKGDFIEDLDILFNYLNLHNINHYYILASDQNSKYTNWGNPQNNNKGGGRSCAGGLRKAYSIFETTCIVRCYLPSRDRGPLLIWLLLTRNYFFYIL